MIEQHEFIKSVQTINTGGNTMVDVVELDDGTALSIFENGVALWTSVEAFLTAEESVASAGEIIRPERLGMDDEKTVFKAGDIVDLNFNHCIGLLVPYREYFRRCSGTPADGDERLVLTADEADQLNADPPVDGWITRRIPTPYTAGQTITMRYKTRSYTGGPNREYRFAWMGKSDGMEVLTLTAAEADLLNGSQTNPFITRPSDGS